MASSESIFNAILDSVVTVTRAKRTDLSPQTRLISDLHMESIDMLDLLFEIERTLNLSINLAGFFQDQNKSKMRSAQFDLEIAELATYVGNLAPA